MVSIDLIDTIKLEPWGFGSSSDDGPDDSCQGIRLRGYSKGISIEIVWESCLKECDEVERHRDFRHELSRYLANNGICPDLSKCQNDCIYDWEYEFSFTADLRS